MRRTFYLTQDQTANISLLCEPHCLFLSCATLSLWSERKWNQKRPNANGLAWLCHWFSFVFDSNGKLQTQRYTSTLSSHILIRGQLFKSFFILCSIDWLPVINRKHTCTHTHTEVNKQNIQETLWKHCVLRLKKEKHKYKQFVGKCFFSTLFFHDYACDPGMLSEEAVHFRWAYVDKTFSIQKVSACPGFWTLTWFSSSERFPSRQMDIVARMMWEGDPDFGRRKAGGG